MIKIIFKTKRGCLFPELIKGFKQQPVKEVKENGEKIRVCFGNYRK